MQYENHVDLNLNIKYKNGKGRNKVYSSACIQKQNDLKLYKESEMESTFLKIIEANEEAKLFAAYINTQMYLLPNSQMITWVSFYKNCLISI